MSRRGSRFPLAASVVAVCVIAFHGVRAAEPPRMPVSELRTGMVGVGRTVFAGTKVEEFKVQVLGVIENVMAPQRNLILARLDGGPLAEAGVIAGMSGSPVYIDGRLIGAVSYALGSFSKEPIAGITPIQEMTAETAKPAMRPVNARVQVDLPITQDGLVAAFRKALNFNRPFAERATDVRASGITSIAGVAGDQLGTLLRPIATPLVMSGFGPDATDLLTAAFGGQGFIPTGGAAAGTRPGEMPFDGPLKPGDAIGVNFVTGDFLLGGTGTVTHIDGDQVYAFGHPMYGLGPTEFPMTRAYVYTILPSLYSSTKLASTGETIGTFLHDRPTAIAGRLGVMPAMIPVTVNLTSDHAPARTFKFGVVRDQLFTPLMTYTALMNLFAGYERQFGASTFTVKGSIDVANQGSIALDNIFAGDNAVTLAGASLIGPLTAIVSNDFEPAVIDKVDLTIASSEEPRTATLTRAWLDEPRPRAGQTVPLKVVLHPYRGDDIVRTIPIEIPANATGNLSVLVMDGARLTQVEQREARTTQSRPTAQLLRELNRTRRGDTLYVRLVNSEPGATVNGETLPSLPPSVLAVMEGDKSGGINALTNATIGQWELRTDRAVIGSKTVSVPLSRK
jgi:hypothetical protein